MEDNGGTLHSEPFDTALLYISFPPLNLLIFMRMPLTTFKESERIFKDLYCNKLIDLKNPWRCQLENLQKKSQ